MTLTPHDFIQSLPPGQKRQFDRQAIISHPEKGEDVVFFMESGQARIFLTGAQREQTIGHLQAGSIFVTHAPVWIEAMAPTCTVNWPIRQLRALFAAQPEVAITALREVGSILANTIELIESLAFHSVHGRLTKYLLAEYEKQNSRDIQLFGTMEILASLLGTSRQTLSTLLNQMIKDGLLERLERDRLLIVDPEKLEALSAS